MLKKFLKKIIRRFLLFFNLEVSRIKSPYHQDMNEEFIKIYEECERFTTTPIERMFVLYKLVKHIVKNKIPGDFVECGVWQGGSCMLMAKTLLLLGDTQRKIYLYDTFDGYSEPTSKDIEIISGKPVNEVLEDKAAIMFYHEYHQKDVVEDKSNDIKWCYAPIDVVKKNLGSTGYPQENIIFVEGKVEDTIPKTIPDQIALMRLDTNWYESTKHELTFMYPIIVKHGVICFNDYGHFQGAQDAYKEYWEENKIESCLIRTDYANRVAIKQ
jgi:hypothetical protein